MVHRHHRVAATSDCVSYCSGYLRRLSTHTAPCLREMVHLVGFAVVVDSSDADFCGFEVDEAEMEFRVGV